MSSFETPPRVELRRNNTRDDVATVTKNSVRRCGGPSRTGVEQGSPWSCKVATCRILGLPPREEKKAGRVKVEAGVTGVVLAPAAVGAGDTAPRSCLCLHTRARCPASGCASRPVDPGRGVIVWAVDGGHRHRGRQRSVVPAQFNEHDANGFVFLTLWDRPPPRRDRPGVAAVKHTSNVGLSAHFSTKGADEHVLDVLDLHGRQRPP